MSVFLKSFLGFLIVVQDKDEKKKGSPIGQFSVTGIAIKGINCKGENSGVSHTSPDLKSEVTIDWQIPSDYNMDSVIVRATVVYEYTRGDHVRKIYTLPENENEDEE